MKFSLVRLSIFFLLAILFPFVQKQWLNLYLFDINNFTISKLLYYLSGLIVPIFVSINSLNMFTYYKFNYPKKTSIKNINGKFLFLITLVVLSLLSILVSHYIFINLIIFLNLIISKNEYLVQFDIDKQIIIVLIISTFLIFKKTKYFIKKLIITNFLIFSIITWYLQINSSLLVDIVPFYIFKFGNLNFLNISFLLAIEIIFYLWSYISYGSYLSDWNVPKPCKKEVTPILKISFFYFLIGVYYSIISK